MDLLEPGGRKLVELLGSGSPPEEGADAAITSPETQPKSSPQKASSLFIFLFPLTKKCVSELHPKRQAGFTG